jgi:hypothetical protein
MKTRIVPCDCGNCTSCLIAAVRDTGGLCIDIPTPAVTKVVCDQCPCVEWCPGRRHGVVSIPSFSYDNEEGDDLDLGGNYPARVREPVPCDYHSGTGYEILCGDCAANLERLRQEIEADNLAIEAMS